MGGGSGYAGRVVDALLELRDRCGWTQFDRAWRAAMAICPPSGTWVGAARRALFEDGEPTVTPLEFLERVCREAWEGARGAELSVSDLRDLMGDVDESEYARPFGRRGKGGRAVLA